MNYSNVDYISEEKNKYEKLLGIRTFKQYMHDGVIYVVDEGSLGYTAVRFYDNDDYRIVGKHTSLGEAMSYAISYM